VADEPAVVGDALHRYELDNGLAIIVLEDHRLPRVSLGIRLRRGAASVERERAGLAGFSASLMKRGAGDLDALGLASAIDEIGSALHVNAGWDSVTAQVWGLTRDLDRLLEILADVVLRPRFASEEAVRTRGEILASLERAQLEPDYLERRFAMDALYPDHRAGLPLAGELESVARLDEVAARGFHSRFFVPNDAVFFASGNVDAEDLLARLGRAFGAWAPAELPGPGPSMPAPRPTSRRIILVDRPDLAQARITLAQEGISRTDPERIAAALMNSVIGGSGFSSRMMSRLRADAGLTYGVSSGFSMRRGGGIFSASTATRASEARRVLDLVLAELERARQQPPTGPELEVARALAVGNFALALETSDAVLGALVDLEVYGLPEDALDTYRSRVRATTTADTARAASQLLHPERAAVVLVGPADQLLPQLEGLGPIEVVHP
jgi:zinc protease